MKDVTALILCGGKGSRLLPLTKDTPQPLVEINKRPILSHLVDHISKFNIKNIVVAVGYKGKKIKNFFEEEYSGLNVSIVDSGDVDIIKRIKDCSFLIDGDFIIFYGDTLTNVNLDKLQKFHRSHSEALTMTLWPLKSQFGLVEIDRDDNVTSFLEKPTLDKWVNIGSFYCEQSVFMNIKKFPTYLNFLESVGKNSELKIKGYRHNGVHITINTLQDLEVAEQEIYRLEGKNE